MSEIDRVAYAIDSHFEIVGSLKDADGANKVLEDAIERAIFMAESKVQSEALERSRKSGRGEKFDSELAAYVEAAAEALKAAKEKPSADSFKLAARKAMIARRAMQPRPGEQPWDPPRDPEECLLDDNDVYSYAIFDSLVEPIQESLPPLYQLGCEGWEDEEGSDA